MCMDGVHTGAYLWTYEDQKWTAAVALSSSPPYLLRWSLANRKPMVRLGWLSREPRGYLSLPPPSAGFRVHHHMAFSQVPAPKLRTWGLPNEPSCSFLSVHFLAIPAD